MMRREEVVAAGVVEFAAPTLLGRNLGTRTARDGRDGSDLRVDFTYDDCEPPVALEVTAVHGPKEQELWTAIHKKLERQLEPIVVEESLGDWLVVLNADADVKALAPELGRLMRTKTSIRPGDYSSDELLTMPRHEAQAFVRAHRELARLGLGELQFRGDEKNEMTVFAFTGEGGPLRDLTGDLTARIDDNLSKLREVDQREAHLAVLVYDVQLSRRAERTPVPAFPDDLSFLWVIHTWPNDQPKPEVWVAGPRDAAWRRATWRLDVIDGMADAAESEP